MNKYTKSVVQAISEKDRSAYTTASGAIIEELQKVAKEKDIVSYANICLHYSDLRPEATEFIAHRTPGIICNNYFLGLTEFDYETFVQWSIKNTPGWGDGLVATARSPSGLKNAIDAIIEAVNQHRRS